MLFVICTNDEIVRNRTGFDEDNLRGYDSADLVKIGSDAAEAKLVELCGSDVYSRIKYDSIFRNWNGGKYSKQGKFAAYQSCGELIACDINSPSMKDIAFEAHQAYDDAVEIFLSSTED